MSIRFPSRSSMWLGWRLVSVTFPEHRAQLAMPCSSTWQCVGSTKTSISPQLHFPPYSWLCAVGRRTAARLKVLPSDEESFQDWAWARGWCSAGSSTGCGAS